MDSPVALGNKNRDRAGDVRMFDSGVQCSAAEIKNKLNKSAAGMILYTPCHLRTENDYNKIILFGFHLFNCCKIKKNLYGLSEKYAVFTVNSRIETFSL